MKMSATMLTVKGQFLEVVNQFRIIEDILILCFPYTPDQFLR